MEQFMFSGYETFHSKEHLQQYYLTVDLNPWKHHKEHSWG